ncbi:ABC transporter permease [Dactylosporangium sp. CA-233914]|uniref:ABC transporter permease n=1 Tax=Dactylosporangium sp. CA-233914 TaxID=3239934 RepID=UPI003D943257
MLDANAPGRRSVLRRLPAVISTVLLALIALCAAVFPMIARVDLGATDLLNRLKPPVFEPGGSWAHPLGTDPLGHDYLVQLIYATRNSLGISVAGMLIATVIGTLIGIVAGLWGGIADALLAFLVDVRLAVPSIVIATACAAFFGSTPQSLILIIGLTGWAGFARIVRGEILRLRELTFIVASRSMGASRGRILVEHVLPNISSLLIVNATLQLNSFILLESGLSFLGLGLQPPNVSLGLLASKGRDYLIDQWWLAVAPSLVIVFVIAQLTLLGDRLRDRSDPRLRPTS